MKSVNDKIRSITKNIKKLKNDTVSWNGNSRPDEARYLGNSRDLSRQDSAVSPGRHWSALRMELLLFQESSLAGLQHKAADQAGL